MKSVEPRDEGLERHLHRHRREVPARAFALAVAERKVVADVVAADVQLLGVGDEARIAVGGDEIGDDRRVGRDHVLAQLYRAREDAVLRLDRAGDPDQLLIDRDLFRLRPFTGASTALLLFSTAFGAMLLSVVLWEQDVWGWSALRTGLAVAPGPLMVPIFAQVAGRLIPRIGAGAVIAAGGTLFAIGTAWWALAAGLEPDYVGDMLGGMLLTGIGTGLALPSLIATGSASLPPHAFATGSGVVTMLREIGLAVGVALLVAILGSPHSPAGALSAYQRGWTVIAAISFASGVVALVLLAAPRRAAQPAAAA